MIASPSIFVCQRVIDDVLLDNIRSKWAILAEVSNRLHVKVTFEDVITEEGYECLRFLIRGETLEQTMQYVEAVRTLPGLEIWEPLDPEMDTLYSPDSKWWSLPYGYNLFEELAYPFDGKRLETWDEDARTNRILQEMLVEYPPIFLAHDWVVPAILPKDWLKLYFKATNHASDIPEVAKRQVATLKKILSKTALGTASQCRYLASLLSIGEKSGVRLMLCIHHQELLEFFVTNLQTFGILMETWDRISVESFRQGRVIWGARGHLPEQRRADLLQLVEEARRLNGGG